MGYGVPSWVDRDLRAYLRCGILAHGFTRVRSEDCGHELLLAYSCGGRGACPPRVGYPSCNTRRMAGVAAHVTDHVLPRFPVRQWVLSVPKRLRPFLEGSTDIDVAGTCTRRSDGRVVVPLGWVRCTVGPPLSRHLRDRRRQRGRLLPAVGLGRGWRLQRRHDLRRRRGLLPEDQEAGTNTRPTVSPYERSQDRHV